MQEMRFFAGVMDYPSTEQRKRSIALLSVSLKRDKIAARRLLLHSAVFSEPLVFTVGKTAF